MFKDLKKEKIVMKDNRESTTLSEEIKHPNVSIIKHT